MANKKYSTVSCLGLLGLFLVSSAVIHLELLLIRITSVILWSHYTPLILSLALFGFGVSGALWASSRKEFRDDSSKCSLSFVLAILFAAAVIFGFFIYTKIPLLMTGEVITGIKLVYWALTIVALSTPFFFGGTLIGLWIIFAGESSGKIYGVNLIGSGIGSLSYLFAISLLGASGSIFFLTSILFASAVCFSLKNKTLWQAALSFVLLLASIGTILFGDLLLPVKAPVGKRVSGISSQDILYTGWNAISRIDVMPPGFEGSPHFTVLIDGGAATTYIPLIEKGLLDEDPDSVRPGNPLIHQIKKGPSVLIVGSGGGIDVRDFLVNGASQVTAVEINPLMNELVGKRFREEAGNLYEDPRVRVVTGDARVFLSKTKKTFDIIHLGLPITNSALASGAVNLSENTLLTKEAMEMYFSHLAPGGIFYLYHDELSALKVVSIAGQLFGDGGLGSVSLAESTAVLLHMRGLEERPITEFRAELLIKKDGLNLNEIEKIRDFSRKCGLAIRYIPGERGQNYFHRFFDGTLGENEKKLFPNLLNVPTDDRPYFFHLITWKDFFRQILDRNFGTNLFRSRITAGESNLFLALILVLIFISPVIVYSLPMLAKSTHPVSTWFYILAGTASGFGFMLLEFVLLSWLRILWGSPETAAMLIFSVLLIAAGLGSLSVRFLSRKISGFALILSATIFALCLVAVWGMPELIRILWATSEGTKVITTLMILIPVGFVIGMPFAWILERLSPVSHVQSGWAWVYNIFGSSLGSILGFMIAMDYGYSNLFGIAALCYAIFLIMIGFSGLFVKKETGNT